MGGIVGKGDSNCCKATESWHVGAVQIEQRRRAKAKGNRRMHLLNVEHGDGAWRCYDTGHPYFSLESSAEHGLLGEGSTKAAAVGAAILALKHLGPIAVDSVSTIVKSETGDPTLTVESLTQICGEAPQDPAETQTHWVTGFIQPTKSGSRISDEVKITGEATLVILQVDETGKPVLPLCALSGQELADELTRINFQPPVKRQADDG